MSNCSVEVKAIGGDHFSADDNAAQSKWQVYTNYRLDSLHKHIHPHTFTHPSTHMQVNMYVWLRGNGTAVHIFLPMSLLLI